MPPPPPMYAAKKKKAPHVSWMAVLFVVILTIVLVILGERFMADLNQWLNPAYDQYGGSSAGYWEDQSYLQGTPMPKSYDRADYEIYRLLIHTAFVIPVLLAAFLLYFWLYYKNPGHPKRLIAWPYFIFSVWMVLHLIIEAFVYLIKQYEKLGIYIVLLLLVGVLTWLVLFLQKKYHQKHNPEPTSKIPT